MLSVNFCKQNQLIIANKHRRKHTWTSSGEEWKIPLILLQSETRKLLTDTHVISTPDISDHTLVRCKTSPFYKAKTVQKQPPEFQHQPSVRLGFKRKLSITNYHNLKITSLEIMNEIQETVISAIKPWTCSTCQ